MQGASLEDLWVSNFSEVEAIKIFPSVETKVIHQGGKTGIILKPSILEKITFSKKLFLHLVSRMIA